MALRTEMAQTRQGDPLESLPTHYDSEEGLFEWVDWWHTDIQETD